MNLKGKIALVTGAGRLQGIGAAICKTLASKGANIFFTYWSPYDRDIFPDSQKTDPVILQNEITAYGVACHKMEIDLAQSTSYKMLLNEVEQQLGIPDILINNACFSKSANFEDLTDQMLDQHYFINIKATLMLSVHFARLFNKGKGGRIVSLTSGQSLGPMLNEIAYVTTKGGIDAMTASLAAELGPKGITVNTVNPGPTDTGWMDTNLQNKLRPMFSSGRIGVPQDAARLIAFLVSDDAEWITGQILHSEGGFIRG